jgi:hypothetical protein
MIAELSSVFRDEQEALKRIQQIVRPQIKLQMTESDGSSEYYDDGWVKGGTETWDHFTKFALAESGIEIFFEPYAVAAYAYGPFVVSVPYEDVVDLIYDEYASALDIRHLKYRRQAQLN